MFKIQKIPTIKNSIVFLCISSMTIACSRKITHGIFESRKNEDNHAFVFDKSRFIFKEKESSAFLSEGRWRSASKEILLTSDSSSRPDSSSAVGDTKWVDLTSKRLKVLSKDKIALDGTTYYRIGGD